MKIVKHGHRFGDQVISESLLSEVCRAVERTNIQPKSGTTSTIKDTILNSLKATGWSDEVALDLSSGITITSAKDRVGLCFQTGNMSRMYADLLKLQTLYLRDSINAAIFLVPTAACAKVLGSNIASFDRLVSELAIFERTISAPIAVIGVE